jgi:3-phenylpropionate/trans-cinnamate dioxygenase ferredoxin reductase subunit
MIMKTVLIIGGGHAAAAAVVALRASKWDGKIVMISDENDLPYQRPPLSKGYLLGSINEQELPIKSRFLYDKLDCELKLGITVTHIDRNSKKLTTKNGEHVNYDHLIIATGTSARKLSVPGADLECVHYLRILADAKRIKQYIAPKIKLLIVGAGYIGLEIAASATKIGASVVVLETQERVLSRVTNPEMSDFYQTLHASNGVDIKLNTGLNELRRTSTGYQAFLNNGEILYFDLAVVGIGVQPNQALAEEAGLECNNGIVVDSTTRTKDPSIYAIGDVSNHPNAFYTTRLRLESVPNATEQAKIAAKNICGIYSDYNALPWFWSEQYDVKLQTAGLSQGYDMSVLRGDMSTHSFALFYLKAGKLIAMDAINSPRDFIKAKQLILAGFNITPERIEDINSDWFS